MIHVEGLTKYYNDLCAVDHIDLDIQKGEILGLLGPNGAGKTTTLRMLTGFLRPTYGSIRVKDYTIDENSLEIKKLLGYLPESAPSTTTCWSMIISTTLPPSGNLTGNKNFPGFATWPTFVG